jgi:peptide/nickel transport system substrate-binding protein
MLVACAPAAPAPTTAPAQSGAAPAKAEAKPAAGVPTRIGAVFGAEPRSMDPIKDVVQTSLVVHFSVFDPLIGLSPEGQYIPALAEAWESVSPTTWRLKLRSGVQFTNGEPFNAEAVRFSLQAYRDGKGMQSPNYTNLTEVKVVDPQTVEITTSQPDSAFLSYLTTMFPLPPKYYEQVGSDGFNAAPIGTGPYVFESWKKGDSIQLKANEQYWKGAPAIKQVTFRYAPEASTRVAMLLSGEVDIATDVPPSMVDQIKNSGAASVKTTPTHRRLFVEFNLKEPPFNDVRLRKAVVHAIDNESLAKNVLSGYGKATDSILPSLMPAHSPEGNGTPLKYDPAKARQLLTEAGMPNGFSFPFYYTVGRYLLDREIAEAIIGQLGQVGIKAESKGLESGAFFAELTKQTMPGAHMLTLGAYAPDEHRVFSVHHTSRSLYQYMNDKRMDELVFAPLAEFDRAKRTQLYKQTEKYAVEDLIAQKSLFWYTAIYGVSNKLNWTPYNDEFLRLELIK